MSLTLSSFMCGVSTQSASTNKADQPWDSEQWLEDYFPFSYAALVTLLSLSFPTGLRSRVCVLSHVQLFVTPWTGSSVYEIFQARILEWVAISYSRGSSQPRDGTLVSCIFCIGRRIFLPLCHLEAEVIFSYKLSHMILNFYHIQSLVPCFSS